MAQQLVNAVVLGGIYSLFALGLSLSWGVLDILNLAHASIFLLGAFVAWVLTEQGVVSIVLLLPLAMAAAALASVLLDWIVYRPIRRRYRERSSRELAVMIGGVAIAAIPVTLAAQVWQGQAKSLPESVMHIVQWNIAGLRITNAQLLTLALAITLSLGLTWAIRYSKYGAAMRAVAEDPDTCDLLGVSATRYATATMAVSGALAGAAGVLLSLVLSSMNSSMGDTLLVKGFALIVIAGVGNIGGALLAAFLLAIVETGMLVYVDASLKDLVAYAVILALLMVRPQGLFAKASWDRL